MYSAEEAKNKINEYRVLLTHAEQEIDNLNHQNTEGSINPEALREELIALRNRNLTNATFADKMELVARLGVKVIPSEDLQSRSIRCNLSLNNVEGKEGNNGFTKVPLSGDMGIRTPDLPDGNRGALPIELYPHVRGNFGISRKLY